jgi:glutathione gamma-glutamylcysteinyltransferase
LFREALDDGGMEGYFALSEQFHTQSEPAYCGLGTLTMCLNALSLDPQRTWRGPWRWFSEELLDCCVPLDVSRKVGVTLDEFLCIARCNGASAEAYHATDTDIRHFRRAVTESSARSDAALVVSYSRRVLGQTGDGVCKRNGGQTRPY